MHKKFGVYTRATELTERELALWLQLRISMIEEELNELEQAHFKRDAGGVIDALVDINVFATGTMDILGVDANKAWDLSLIHISEPTRPY